MTSQAIVFTLLPSARRLIGLVLISPGLCPLIGHWAYNNPNAISISEPGGSLDLAHHRRRRRCKDNNKNGDSLLITRHEKRKKKHCTRGKYSSMKNVSINSAWMSGTGTVQSCCIVSSAEGGKGVDWGTKESTTQITAIFDTSILKKEVAE